MIGKFFGLRVFVREDVPKMQLSEGCPVTPEFRAEMNAWMLSFFGVKSAIPDGEFWEIAGKELHMNPRTFREFKAKLPQTPPEIHGILTDYF